MIVFLLLAVLVAVPVVVGFIRAQKERHISRRHLAAFVGFSSALVGALLTCIAFGVDTIWPGPAYYHPIITDIVAICSFGWLAASVISLVAGVLSTGRSRLILILYAPITLVIYMFAALGNMGN